MTDWKTVSFETRLSDRKKPFGSEKSVTSVQKVRSSRRCGSASTVGLEVGVTHRSSATIARDRIASWGRRARVIYSWAGSYRESDGSPGEARSAHASLARDADL